MRRLLVITTLDYQREPNQRVHHQVRHLAPAFDQTTVLYLRWGRPARSWREYARSMLVLETIVRWDGPVKFVEVDPFWNPPAGSTLRYIRFLNTFLFVVLSLFIGYVGRIRQHADVVLAAGPHAAAVGYALKRLGAARLLVYDDIDYEPGLQGRRFKVRFLDWMERFFLARADLRISAGDALAELRRAQGIDGVTVVTNGVEYELFSAAQRKIAHPPTVLYTGNISMVYSGLEVAFRALPKIARRYPDIRLVVVGGSDPREERHIRALVHDLGVDRWVWMRGRCAYEELPRHAAEADIGWAVFPLNDTRRYAFPNKVIEYMAAGLAVLGTAGSQTARLIECHRCGIVVPYDADSVAAAVISLLDNPERLEGYRCNGAQAAAAFDWPSLIERQRALIVSGLDSARTTRRRGRPETAGT